jgi:hypothetical protein
MLLDYLDGSKCDIGELRQVAPVFPRQQESFSISEKAHCGPGR